jgi:hypothetical protein
MLYKHVHSSFHRCRSFVAQHALEHGNVTEGALLMGS